MAGLGPLSQVPVADPGSPLITRHGDEIARAYLDAVVDAAAGSQASAAAGSQAGRAELTVVYTPMHGVAGRPDAASHERRRVSRRRTWWRRRPGPIRTSRRSPTPTPRSPARWTWPWPTRGGSAPTSWWPATPTGTGWRVAARRDGDEPDGWVVLTGDQAGSLLGASMLDRTAGGAEAGRRLVATTIVSSTLLSKVAAAAGAHYAETLTGFKWIARAADGVPGARFVFGYEEALGYAVGDVVRDKDGIGAALAMLAVAAEAKATGRSVLDRYDELERAHGVHLTSQVTLRTADQARVMRAAAGRSPGRARRPAGDRPWWTWPTEAPARCRGRTC